MFVEFVGGNGYSNCDIVVIYDVFYVWLGLYYVRLRINGIWRRDKFVEVG